MATSIDSRMLSRAGKASSSNFRILKHRDSITQGKHETKVVKYQIPHSNNKKRKLLEILTLADIETQKIEQVKYTQQSSIPSEVLNSEFRTGKTYAFASQSRVQFYDAIRNKDAIPPAGHYNLNYSLLEKKVPVPTYVSNKSNKRSVSMSELPIYIKSKKLKPYKPPKKTSSLEFSKMKGRTNTLKVNTVDSNEGKTVSLNLSPSNCTRFRRISTPQFKNYLPRKNHLFKTQQFLPQYTPNKEKIMLDLGRCISFKNTSKRRSFIQTLETPDPYNINSDHADKLARVPSFEKYLPREKDLNSPLPSYMHVYTRSSMKNINAKMLKDINYSESTFLSPRSTFMTKSHTFSPSMTLTRNESFIIYDNLKFNV